VQCIEVPGRHALEELNRLRRAFRRAKSASRLWPILVGGDEDWESIEEGLTDRRSPKTILSKSRKIDAGRWLKQELARLDGTPPAGNWPLDATSGDRMITHLDPITLRPLKKAWIVLLPIAEPWEAFAGLHWGGFNACPPAEVHCALHRRWQKRFGAKVVSITHDVVQCAVARPPRSRRAALELAREQFLYCSDIVLQGTDTIEGLAGELLRSRCWFFWWD
jgi:hypothetical protein